jgi:hypothetical protein
MALVPVLQGSWKKARAGRFSMIQCGVKPGTRFLDPYFGWPVRFTWVHNRGGFQLPNKSS